MELTDYKNLINEIERNLRRSQSSELFEHSLGTRDYALRIAEKHQLNIDPRKIIIAALLHDYAKEYNEKDLFRLAGDAGYIFDNFELENPYLLHGEIAAYEIKNKYGIDDDEILHAIRSHTTGDSKMTDLDLLVFVADKLERNRDYPDVDKLRKAVETDFLSGALEVLKHHRQHVISAKKKLHPRTDFALNELLNRLKPEPRFKIPKWLNVHLEPDPSKKRDMIRFFLTMDGFIVVCSLVAVLLTFLLSSLFGLWFMFDSIGTGETPSGYSGIFRRSQPASAFFQNRKEMFFVIAGLDGIHDYERTDTLMLVKLNLGNNTVKIISIPRDTLVKIPNNHHYWDRINVAYPIGKQKLLLDTIANLTGYYPDYLVMINYDGFKTIVDIVGGVEIDVEKNMDYDDYAGKLHIHLKKGLQLLNGEDALGYVRFRRDFDGDFSRVKRQQKFLAAFKNRLLSPGTSFKVGDIMRAVMANVKVTAVLPGNDEPLFVDNGISFQQYLVLAKVMESLPEGNISAETVKMRSDGEFYNGMSVQIIDYDEFDKAMLDFFNP